MYDTCKIYFVFMSFFYLYHTGGATSTLRILFKGAPFFTGCMEDVVLDDEVLIPRTVPQPMRVGIIREKKEEINVIMMIVITVFAYSLHKEVFYSNFFFLITGFSPGWLSSC